MNDMKQRAIDNYALMASACLMNFQLIEELLRQILPELYGLVDRSTSPMITFRWNEKKLAKASLGRLVGLFGQVFASDEELIRELRGVVQNRNMIAHSALLVHIGVEHDASVILKDADERFEPLRARLDQIIRKLLDLHSSIGDQLLGNIDPPITTASTAPVS
jgi:hypothetical protein